MQNSENIKPANTFRETKENESNKLCNENNVTNASNKIHNKEKQMKLKQKNSVSVTKKYFWL